VDQEVDITASGTYTTGTLPPSPHPTVTATVDSYLVHADKVGTGVSAVSWMYSITFSQDILGIILSAPDSAGTTGQLLADTDSVFGLAGTTYSGTQSYRGLEFGTDFSDTITLSADLRTLEVDSTVRREFMDEIRVITAVPIPAAAWLFGSGLIGLVAIGRRRRV